ncbi:MAG: hypothetical protein HKP03_01740 [Xanthomonadales bacterium]|nr:hypothetical protein [Gammaproteobacteria bacterium]NNK37176.1 hypothetical protein [Xanthomonadales bacterium]
MSRKSPGSLIAMICLLSACGQAAAPPGPEMARLQQSVLQKQEELLQIHLDLDSAALEIAEAEQMAQSGNCSGAEFHAAESYRMLRKADDSILELGTELQALFNLDSGRSGRK